MATTPQVTPTKPQWRPPVGTIHVVDPSPLNWLFITWNTMEEPIRVNEDGRVVNAAALVTCWDKCTEGAVGTGNIDVRVYKFR